LDDSNGGDANNNDSVANRKNRMNSKGHNANGIRGRNTSNKNKMDNNHDNDNGASGYDNVHNGLDDSADNIKLIVSLLTSFLLF